MNQPFELTVMMYHYVRDLGDEAEAGSGIPGMAVEAFETQLNELSREHIFVTWPDVQAAVEQERSLPRAACLLTFDDGVRDHYVNVFRILCDRKLSGLFFVLARGENDGLILGHKIHFLLAKLGLAGLRDGIWQKLDSTQREQFAAAENQYRLKYPPISRDGRINLLKAVLQRDFSAEAERVLSDLFEVHIGSEKEAARSYYLNAEQMAKMSAAGMHFGGHSRSHPWFDWIDAETRTREIRASAEWLPRCELGPWAFAYPYGGLSDDSPQLLQKHGFLAAFTTRTQWLHTDAYLIGRLDGEEMAQTGTRYA
jgi:peptidoglycan/xylan/chitin deacetylase (PgdA/CDA1 family)